MISLRPSLLWNRSPIASTFTIRDGFHLDLTLGRYTVACAWCEFLTKKSVKGNPYFPNTIQREQAMKVQKAAHKAF
jgi:hypothetical protein